MATKLEAQKTAIECWFWQEYKDEGSHLTVFYCTRCDTLAGTTPYSVRFAYNSSIFQRYIWVDDETYDVVATSRYQTA